MRANAGLRCHECGAEAGVHTQGWRAYICRARQGRERAAPGAPVLRRPANSLATLARIVRC
jgi:hypothetical protein